MIGNQNNIITSEQSIVLLPFELLKDEIEVQFCLNVQKISCVLEMNDCSILPGAMAPFVFLIDVGGMPVPVLELNNLINSTLQEQGNKINSTKKNKKHIQKRIIVCHFLNLHIGIIVNATKKILIQSNEFILPPPSLWDNNENFYISGLLKEKNYYRYLFDIEKYVASLGINIGQVEIESKIESKLLENKKILIVEDSAVYQLLLKKAFAKYNIQLDQAKDGKQGLALLMEKGETYNAIISDIEMPYMNGIEMIRLYKETKKLNFVPVIFHSAISNPNLAKDIAAANLGEYISKFNEEEIVKKVENIIKMNN